VIAFYQALQAGQGAEAARFVVPEKRDKGPLSAEALTSFYGNLKSYLTFIDLRPLRENEYEALYTYELPSGKFCNGRSVVRTTKVDDRNLIAGIEAKSGC